MTHVIVTCSDSRCGDFLTRHWGRSLKENVDLRDVDVMVFDYGLTDTQRQAAEALGFQTRPVRRDGHITNVRFRDTCDWLSETSYDQVLSIDGGDIIFQTDIRHLFEQDQQQFRAVCEDVPVQSFGQCIETDDFEPAVFREIYEPLEHRPLINCGFVLGPREKMIGLFQECCAKTTSLRCVGVDQIMVNYHLYQRGFVALEPGYNFVVLTTKRSYALRNGQFFNGRGQLIPVVHNAGMSTRIIRDFGYGPGHNRKDRVVAVGRVVWFMLPISVRKHLAEWCRRALVEPNADAHQA